ncbi:hypothetical protein ACHAWF_006084 [Thalassiosira exigua]
MSSNTRDSPVDSATIAAAAAEAKRNAQEKSARDKETCEKYVRNGLDRNVTVQFLFERLLEMGCRPPDNLIRCLDCKDNKRGGGFGAVEEIDVSAMGGKKSNKSDSCAQTKKEIDALISKERDGGTKLKLVPEIYLCQQHLKDQTHAHEAMVHELIHAVDMCRTKMDPISNCIHMACTEIRAENLSGECNMLREMQ